MTTQILDITKSREQAIETAVSILKQGAVIAFPTETVYGIGADLLNIEAINRIYEIKQRDFSKPLAAYINDVSMLKQICVDVPENFYKLADAFLPGPLTIVLKKNKLISDIVTSGMDTIAIRMVDNQIVNEIIKKCGFPIAGTSANISGENSATNVQEIIRSLSGKIELILDDGDCKYGIESTIISLIEGTPKLLRKGVISAEEIEIVIGQKIR